MSTCLSLSATLTISNISEVVQYYSGKMVASCPSLTGEIKYEVASSYLVGMVISVYAKLLQIGKN